MSKAIKKIKKPFKSVIEGVKDAGRDIDDKGLDYVRKIGDEVKRGADTLKTAEESQLMGKKPKVDTPKVRVAPDPDTKEIAKSSGRTRQRMKRSGRTSTVLTPGTKLG